MLEYGIKVSSDAEDLKKANPKVLYVYFTPMTYYDWIYFSSSSSSYDPAHIRGIFSRYITRIEYTGPERDQEYTLLDLLKEDDNITMKIVNKMLEKAGFDDEEMLLSTVRTCREKSMTLAGTYDSFVLINTDVSFYTQFINSDIFTRAQIISSLEKMKHFTVEDRYMDCIKEKIEINLVHGPEEYEKWKFDRNKKIAMAGHDKQKQQPVPSDKKEILGDDLHSVIEQSKHALDEAFRISKQQPRQAFDWEKDEKDFGD